MPESPLTWLLSCGHEVPLLEHKRLGRAAATSPDVPGVPADTEFWYQVAATAGPKPFGLEPALLR